MEGWIIKLYSKINCGLVLYYNSLCVVALNRILETVVTFHFSGGKVYLLNKECLICMIKYTMHVQSLHCSIYLTWLDVCIYRHRSHFHFLKRMRGKGHFRNA